MVITVSSNGIIGPSTNNLYSKVLGQIDADKIKINIGSNFSLKFELSLNFSEEMKIFNIFLQLN